MRTETLVPVPAPMSQEFMRRALREDVSPDTDVATAQVVRKMCEHVQTSAADPLVQEIARTRAPKFAGLSLYMRGSDAAIADGCFWWVKHFLKFVHHSVLLDAWLGEGHQYQLLISPDVIVRAPSSKRKGDCAIYSSLLASLLKCCGIRFELVTLAVDPHQPGVYSHVFVRAVLPDGRRVNLDSSHGKYPGWQVPAGEVFRTQVWDEGGAPVADTPQFNGLHNYVARGMGDDTTDFTPSTSSVDLQSLYPVAGAYDNQPFTSVPVQATPGGAGFNTAGFLASLANQWTQIGSRVLAPSTTYQRNADGSISLVTPGSSPVLSSSVLSGGSGSTSNLLLLGGLAIAAVVAVKAFSK